MKKLIYLSFLLILSISDSFSTHIVGGEFQLVEQRSGLYDIYLNLYFDVENGNLAAKDEELTAFIYRKSDDVVMDVITLTLQNETLVAYENPDCSIPQISTSKITYSVSGGYQFNPSYNDPEGYYIVWDRCCRNDDIINIEDPDDSGMLFYSHFPRIFDDIDELIGWSSPAFVSVPGTYACVDEYFELDFSASDIDGDSLVYSLSNPLIGNSTGVNPSPASIFPEPYPVANWKPFIDLDNVIPGNPSLQIDSISGLLTMKPSSGGLYVFAVLCEEFRDGVKIGEVRRDFQIFVYENCQKNSPPNATLRLPDNTIYNETAGDTVVISSENSYCLDLLITDNMDIRNSEKIKVRVNTVNFSSEVGLVEEGEDEFVGGVGDTLTGWKICPPSCEDIMDEPFIYDVIIEDDGCPQPKKDTIRLYIELIPEPNEPPELSSNIDGLNDIIIEVFVTDTIMIDFTGLDIDTNDLLTLSAKPINFKFEDFGIEYSTVENDGGLINSTFDWIIDCDYFKNSETDEFEILFILDDNSCYESNPDTLKVTVKIKKEGVDENFHNKFEIINVFTPNGDDINDELIINSLPRDDCDNKYVSFQIYNRWGKRVYKTADRTIKFDGAELNDGIYYYSVEYTESTYKGWFTILR